MLMNEQGALEAGVCANRPAEYPPDAVSRIQYGTSCPHPRSPAVQKIRNNTAQDPCPPYRPHFPVRINFIHIRKLNANGTPLFVSQDPPTPWRYFRSG